MGRHRKKSHKRKSGGGGRHLGGAGMSFYSPTLQAGMGLGNILARLARGIIPLFQKPSVQSGIRKIGRSVASASFDAAQKSLGNPNISFKQALKEEGVKQLKKQLGPANQIKRKKVPKLKSVSFQPLKKKQQQQRRVSTRDIFT